MKAIKIQNASYTDGQTDGMNKYLVSGKDGNCHVYAANAKDAVSKVKAGISN
jgi:hypothetical protein